MEAQLTVYSPTSSWEIFFNGKTLDDVLINAAS